MKEFEGLKIPEIKYATKISKLLIIQARECYDPHMNCGDVDCKDCIYDDRNLEKFEKWWKMEKEK